jgi:hypothetical protein
VSDWPSTLFKPQRGAICPWAQGQPVGELLLGMMNLNFSTAAVWPSANRAIFVPIIVEVQTTVTKLGMRNGAAVNGEVDAGIYSYVGTGTSATRLVSSGKVAQAGTETLQVFDVADTTLIPGVYFLAFGCTVAVTGTFSRAIPQVPVGQAMGVAQMNAAVPLPATATLARIENEYTPGIFAITRTSLL